MFNKIIYQLRLLSVILFVIFIYFLLDIIFKCDVIGITFLISSSLFILINLFTILTRLDIYKKLIGYNLIFLALTFYLGIIVTRLYLDSRSNTLLYQINYDYFKTNFIIIDLVIIGIILNTLFIYFYDHKKVKNNVINLKR